MYVYVFVCVCMCVCMYVCVYVVCVCVCMVTLMSWIYPRHKCRLKTRPRHSVQDSRQDQDLGPKTQDKTKTLKSRSRYISTRHEVSRLRH